MPRADHRFLTGYVWHILHRCPNEEFLLKLARDRRRWPHGLRQAGKRYGFCVLDHIVASNHIYLLVRDQGREEIARGMQPLAGRSGWECNRRESGKGFFREDRCHVTCAGLRYR